MATQPDELVHSAYPEYPYSQFPAHMDDAVFKQDSSGNNTEETYAPPKMSDIDADTMDAMNSYNSEFSKGNFDNCAMILVQKNRNDKKLIDSMFTAEKFNWLRDAMLSMEKFLSSTVLDYINTFVDQKLGIVTEKIASTTAKSNAVAYSARYINSLFVEYDVNLKASNQTGDAANGYSQTVKAVADDGSTIPSEDYVCYPALEKTDSANVKTYNKAYAYLYGGETNTDGTVTMYAWKKPSIDFTVTFKRS